MYFPLILTIFVSCIWGYRGGHENNSSILAWRIPWTEEPGGLQSMGRKELHTTEAT